MGFMRHSLLFFTLFILLFPIRGKSQQLVANINQTNGGSSPAGFMENDIYGAFFARPNGGNYQLFYLPVSGDSLLRFGAELPFGENDLLDDGDNLLVGEDVYFSTKQGVFRANLPTDSLFSLIAPGANGPSTAISHFAAVDGTNKVLFLDGDDKLYFTDGTSAGTEFVSDLPNSKFVPEITTQDGFAYLIYQADLFDNLPAFLYISDGEETKQVSLPIATQYGIRIRRFLDKVLISGINPDRREYVLASPDLSEFRDLSTFPNDSNTLFLQIAFTLENHVYFTRSQSGYVHELLRTDTIATSLDTVVDLNPSRDSLSFFDSYSPETGLLYYLGRGPDRSVSLFRSDLTEEGTFPLTVVQPAGKTIVNISESNLLAGGKFFFKAIREETGEELWVSDGTVDGTKPLGDLAPGIDNAEIEELTQVGQKLMFRANTLNYGEEVMEITRLLADIGPDLKPIFQAFSANNGCNGLEMFKSGGTAASTQIVKDIFPGRAGFHFPKVLGSKV